MVLQRRNKNRGYKTRSKEGNKQDQIAEKYSYVWCQEDRGFQTTIGRSKKKTFKI